MCMEMQRVKAAGGKPKHSVKLNPRFPRLPSVTPLTFTLTMKACLSDTASERPTASQLRTLIADMRHEVAQGSYICTEGCARVRAPHTLPLLSICKPQDLYITATAHEFELLCRLFWCGCTASRSLSCLQTCAHLLPSVKLAYMIQHRKLPRS